jgi:hypothetical protein
MSDEACSYWLKVRKTKKRRPVARVEDWLRKAAAAANHLRPSCR